jgi:hypothetical protein
MFFPLAVVVYAVKPGHHTTVGLGTGFKSL